MVKGWSHSDMIGERKLHRSTVKDWGERQRKVGDSKVLQLPKSPPDGFITSQAHGLEP